ncbi:MAG: Rrf2 family transcriptional regulator [Calditrichaeota bacterium]|nr:Rrf2 family transcriptional regulator [Calditrichota bacterium]
MPDLIKREWDYAIRLCAYLAGSYNKGHVSLTHASKKLFLTRPMLNKIVFQLRQKGILDSVQGKYGGIFLKEDPHKLSVFDVLKAMGYNSNLNECVSKHASCPLIKQCQVHLFFAEQEMNLLGAFKNKMIIELAFSDKDLIGGGG